MLNPWNLDALQELERESGRRIFNILQLRLHPAIIALKERVDVLPQDKKLDIDLTYITSRGNWYYVSWKGSLEKSGGIATNIGIHFFDMLMWIFGDVKSLQIHRKEDRKIGGYLELARANVRWFLSLDIDDIPKTAHEVGKTTHRSLTMNGEEVEFTDGFTDLHTMVYKDILSGGGFGLEDARTSINLAYQIRHAEVVGIKEHSHPFLSNITKSGGV